MTNYAPKFRFPRIFAFVPFFRWFYWTTSLIIYLSLGLCHSSVCPPVYLPACLSVYLYVCLFVYPSVRLFVYLSLILPGRLPAQLAFIGICPQLAGSIAIWKATHPVFSRPGAPFRFNGFFLLLRFFVFCLSCYQNDCRHYPIWKRTQLTKHTEAKASSN